MKNFFILIGLCSVFVNTVFAQKNELSDFTHNGISYKVGDTVLGYKGYVKLVVGDRDSPLIIAVPHDGIEKGNPEIPETGTTGRDINTLPLALEIARNFEKSTKKKAWLIINTIARKRVDPNTYPKDIEDRYNNEALATYKSYHDLILAARSKMAKAQKSAKGALFLDLHGHAHQYKSEQEYITTTGKIAKSKFIDQTELGYGISNFSLKQNNEYLDKLTDSSSIAAIAKTNPNVKFSELIRGPFSFGALLEAEQIVAVPSDKIQILESNEDLFGLSNKGEPKHRPYFNGGYCTRKYGTAQLGSIIGFDDNISAIQAETPGITVRNNKAIIRVSAQRFNRAIIKYLNKWYGYTFSL